MKNSHAFMLSVAVLVIASALLLLTLFVLVQANYFWLACVIFAPLAYGLARWPIWVIAKTRPGWFKPGWLREHDFE